MMGEDYYKEKFLALAEWLKAREEFYNKQACTSLDTSDMHMANKYLASLNATKCARMWIRNHVAFRDGKVET